MKMYYAKPTCLIKHEQELNKDNKDKNSSIRGTACTDYFIEIQLLEEDIKELYDNGTPYIIFVICHELTHIKQYKELFSEDGHLFDVYAIKELKDYLLATSDIKYKEQNYNYLSVETII